MNTPGDRMPIWKSQDKIRIHWLSLLCLLDASYGLVNIFGRSEGASQVLLRHVIPTPLWGAALFGSAALIAFGWSIWGSALGAFAWGMLAGASVATIYTGTALSYAGPILLGATAGWHVLVLYDVHSGLDLDRERRQRRS